MTEDAAGPGVPVKWWCRKCGLPVLREPGDFGRAVHAGTGSEQGDGGHLALPVDTDPAMAAVARAVTAEFPACRAVADGGAYRVWFPGRPGAVAVEAHSEEELRAVARVLGSADDPW